MKVNDGGTNCVLEEQRKYQGLSQPLINLVLLFNVLFKQQQQQQTPSMPQTYT